MPFVLYASLRTPLIDNRCLILYTFHPQAGPASARDVVLASPQAAQAHHPVVPPPITAHGASFWGRGSRPHCPRPDQEDTVSTISSEIMSSRQGYRALSEEHYADVEAPVLEGGSQGKKGERARVEEENKKIRGKMDGHDLHYPGDSM